MPTKHWDPLVPSDTKCQPPIFKKHLRTLSCDPRRVVITEDTLPVTSTGQTYEDVQLDPTIFDQACHLLYFYPSVDLFASREHHQVHRYFSADPSDMAASGHNAFAHHWQSEQRPYLNPPWSLIHRVLEKLEQDNVRAMVFVPEWTWSSWWPLWESFAKNAYTFA